MSQFFSNCSTEAITQAAANLMTGNLVAFPTETVYGLGADACNSHAVAKIFAAKGRPTDHPIIVHISSIHALSDWATEIPSYSISLARDFWPGPMTLILKRSKIVGDFISGGQNTIGLRVPNHPIALELLQEFSRVGGMGIAAPSANRFGRVSPTTAQAVLEELEDKFSETDQVLDGGPCQVGIESTIIDCTGAIPRILRPGAVTAQMIFDSTGFESNDLSDEQNKSKIRFSGSLDSHYAPKAKVVLDRAPTLGEGFIAMAGIMAGHGVVRIASPQNEEEFARVLYSALRAADKQGLKTVVVSQPLGDGIASAIRERLQRASH
jgi:L-threonylcarbamoyladenylate synthase